MRRRTVRIGGALALLLGCAAAVAQPGGRTDAMVEEARRELRLPGMAVALWRDGRIVAEVASGERALGSGVPVLASDPFHLGSITKPFTAALVARLVERGLLSWDDSIGGRLGPLLPELRREYRDVTLGDLLA
ncbi:MAG: beta-lactamase family protein, partial [Pseudomonadota bacterium]|nr:beta-lactamase family protein [Pseudomonadota bacterium]